MLPSLHLRTLYPDPSPGTLPGQDGSKGHWMLGTGCWAQPAGHGSSTPLLVGPQLAHAQSCAMSPHPRCGLRNSLEER